MNKITVVIEELVEALKTCKRRSSGYAGLESCQSFNDQKVKAALAKAETVNL